MYFTKKTFLLPQHCVWSQSRGDSENIAMVEPDTMHLKLICWEQNEKKWEKILVISLNKFVAVCVNYAIWYEQIKEGEGNRSRGSWGKVRAYKEWSDWHKIETLHCFWCQTLSMPDLCWQGPV